MEFYMKRINKFFIIFIILISIILNSTYVYADDLGLGDLDAYKGIGSTSGTFLNKTSNILYIVQVVGTIAAVIVLMVIGIKYLAGSVEERSEYKKNMWPYLLGAFILFAGVPFIRMIYTIARSLFGVPSL